MGVTIYDISDMTNPFYVWQWDKDTGVNEGSLKWNWHGSGTTSTTYCTTTNNQPAVTFGIDWFGGDFSTSGYDPIHLYIGNGCDGLRVLDLTGFIHPRGMYSNKLEFDMLATETYT